MRTALRTALATALVAGVVATPALAAGSAFAAGTAPAPTATASAPAKGAGPAAVKPATETTKPTAEPTAPAAEAAPDADVLVRTVELDGGLTAKVYNRGTQHRYFTATVLRGTHVLGELKAGGGYGAKVSGLFYGYVVTLDAEGKVTSAEPGPEHATLIRTEKLVTGRTAKIYKLQEGIYFAELFRDGRKVGELHSAVQSVADWDPSTEYFVLNPDGTTYNWIGTSAPTKPGHYRLADGTILEVGEKDGYYGLQLIDPATGKGRGFTYLRGGNRKVWFYGKAVVVLESSGSFAAYVPGQAKQAAPQPIAPTVTTPPPAKVLEGPFVIGKCTVTEEIQSSFGQDWLLVITNDLAKGPWAVLKNPQHDVVSRVDRVHPVDTVNGLRIDGANTTTPRFGQRTQGGDTPYRYNDFPALPKGCDASTAPAPASAGSNGSTPQGGQTSVVPQGGVAAGAEFGAEEGSGALVAAGAGAASLAAAGLGFMVLRRRSAAARV
ncbi:hypothetical protein [Streptomyces sp. NPDC004284]|uniref:hypothetical protein n=1 Tax=Streptomyces sp. NPDC004284 TaxID=3364695 RepID=UPI0036D05F31